MANLHLVVAPFVVVLLVSLSSASAFKEQGQSLRFSEKGEFRILQVADMHYGDGKTTPCEDVLPQQVAGCSDLNTTAFLHRMIAAVNPHLIIFTGGTLALAPPPIDQVNNSHFRLRREIGGGDNDVGPPVPFLMDSYLAQLKDMSRHDLLVEHMSGYYGVMSDNAFRVWLIICTQPTVGVDPRADQWSLLTVGPQPWSVRQARPGNCRIIWLTYLKNVATLELSISPSLMHALHWVIAGDNIFGFDATDAASSMNAAFSPAISSNIPWAAVLGNHDQESTLSRAGVMKHIVGMKHSLSQFNPAEVEDIDGFGNYNLEVHGVEGSAFENKSVLNLYFLDSGDYSTVPFIPGYGWIKPSQQFWFENTSKKLQRAYMNKPEAQKAPAPGLAYFHIPLPEFASFDSSNFTGVKQEGISSASVNSGFFTTLVEAGDVKAVFIGHDHVNDFCGELTGIHLCYAGGFGYHAYGKAGWDRRARVVVASLEKTENGGWGAVKSIKTRKYLDNQQLTTIDVQVLWSTGIAFLPPNLFSLCLCFFQFILLQENTQDSML
ncbi:hypothetical protein C3L33_04916, partial [Rhododendron williamsianum]